MSLTLEPATGPFLEQILRETHAVWADGLTPRAYAMFWEAQLRTPWGRAHLDRVALVDGTTVVASAKRYDLPMRLDGRIRRVLGIGAVFTSPSHRGRGRARLLLQRVLETAEAEGYEFALLFSEIGPELYEQLDFVPLPLTQSRLTVTRKDGAPAVLVRALDERDLPAVAETSAARAEGYRLTLDRSDELIAFGISRRRLLAGLGPAGLRQTEVLVAEEGHQAVAYLVVSVEGDQWFIEDAADRDPAGARLGAMLQVMLAREPGQAPPEIHAWWPPTLTPPQITIAETRPSREVMMIRPLAAGTLPLPPIEGSQLLYWRLDAF
ncbi:MAG: GNAT family N-acetyltransferase [Vicinamibacterales bacterium]